MHFFVRTIVIKYGPSSYYFPLLLPIYASFKQKRYKKAYAKNSGYWHLVHIFWCLNSFSFIKSFFSNIQFALPYKKENVGYTFWAKFLLQEKIYPISAFLFSINMPYFSHYKMNNFFLKSAKIFHVAKKIKTFLGWNIFFAQITKKYKKRLEGFLDV